MHFFLYCRRFLWHYDLYSGKAVYFRTYDLYGVGNESTVFAIPNRIAPHLRQPQNVLQMQFNDLNIGIIRNSENELQADRVHAFHPPGIEASYLFKKDMYSLKLFGAPVTAP